MTILDVKRRLDWDALVYAYQHIVLADLAAMRGLIPSLVILAPNPKSSSNSNRLIVARPQHRTGLHDPEQELNFAEILGAIKEGLERYHKEHGDISRASPEEIAEAFLELLKMGYIIIHYSARDQKAKHDVELSINSNSTIKDAAKLVDKYVKNYISVDVDITSFKFKSYHGELARLSANASPLPSRYEAVGFLALPAVLEPLPSKAVAPGLPKEVKEWFYKQCSKESESEALLSALEDALKKAGYQELNTYQYQVISEYFRKRKDYKKPLDVILTAPTGAGKTLAFIIIALLEILAAKCRREREGFRVVLAYPRKTLARDQVEDIAKILSFFNENLEKQGLSSIYTIFLWLRDGSSGVKKCPPNSNECVELPRKPEPIRGIIVPVGESLSPATHYYDEQNNVYKSQPSWLIDVKDDVDIEISGIFSKNLTEKPGQIADIVVTNYDMLFKESIDILKGTPTPLGIVLRDAGLVVLDEAHMAMGGNQSIMIQTYTLALDVAEKRPGIILSSATLLERRLLNPNALLLNVVALELRQGPSYNEALNTFRKLLGLKPSSSTIYIDFYNIASKKPGGWKLTLWTIIYPSVLKKPVTALNEAIVSILHALAAARAMWDRGAQAKTIAFIEYKSSLRDIASELVSRITLESGDIYDRVFLTKLFDKHYSELKDLLNQFGLSDIASQLPKGNRRRAYSEIVDNVHKLVAQDNKENVVDIFWSEYFKRFHSLAPYTSLEDYAFILRCRAYTADKANQFLEKATKYIISKTNKVLPPPLSCDVWMEHVLLHAAIALKHKPWESGQALEDYYKDINSLSSKLNLDLTKFIPILTHHGDYTGFSRHLADRLLEEANPLVILATSTLEVGLNIPGIIATIHYILPREPGRIIQMVGRSGRRPETMRISHGIVILRQNAWESAKRVEIHAFRYFNEITAPPAPSLRTDPYYLARLCITMNQTDCAIFQKHVDQHVIDVADSIVKNRLDIIGEINKMLQSRTGPLVTSSLCSPSLKGKINSIKKMLGPKYKKLKEALDALHIACSIDNHAIILAAAENAYTVTLEVLVNNHLQIDIQRKLNNLLKDVSDLRATIYSHIAYSMIQALDRLYNLDEIIQLLVYPRGFQIPGAGDLKSPAGRVILAG